MLSLSKSIKKLAMTVAVCGAILSTVSPASAVANPGGIAWGASPTAFVTSLYTGVLGRAPESAAVVSAWAANVNSSPGSRKRAFWAFVNSQEYRNSFGSASGRYNVYWKASGRYTQYTVAKRQPGSYNGHADGPYSFGVASALRGYHQAFTRR